MHPEQSSRIGEKPPDWTRPWPQSVPSGTSAAFLAPHRQRGETKNHSTEKKNARPTKRRQRRCPTADRVTEVSTSLWPVARPQRPAATAFVWATPYCFFLCVFFFEDRSRWVGRVPDGDEDSLSRRRRGPEMSGRRSTVTRYGGRRSTLRSRVASLSSSIIVSINDRRRRNRFDLVRRFPIDVVFTSRHNSLIKLASHLFSISITMDRINIEFISGGVFHGFDLP